VGVIILLYQKNLYIANVGDSVIYVDLNNNFFPTEAIPNNFNNPVERRNLFMNGGSLINSRLYGKILQS
jgi:serine/threonine protein phosphatase PrpC